MSWPVVAFSDVIKDVSGGNIKTKQDEYAEAGKYPIVDQGQSLIGGYTDDESRLCNAPQPVIVFGDHTKALKFIDFPFCMGADGTKILQINEGNDPKYLYYALHNVQIPDAGYSRHFKYLKAGKIPLPPLEEQKRIAGILDQADTLRRLRTRALDKLNTLGQAIFHEMFGATKDQNIRKLSDVADLINGDRSSNYPSGEEVKSEGVLFLSTKNIRDWRLEFDTTQFITEQKFASLTRGKLQRGDIVITLRGTLGQAAIFDCEYETGFINAQIMIIRPRTGISAQYLLDFLALDSTQHELNKGQSGSAVKQLTAKQVGELPVVVPDPTQQSEYAKKIAAHHHFRIRHLRQRDQFERLFASLQQRAFRGEL